MDEYANEAGKTAPVSWPGSFQRAMQERFFGLIDPELRPPETQTHFPTDAAIDDYSARLDELGGADVCYGGIGWCGHIAARVDLLQRQRCFSDRFDDCGLDVACSGWQLPPVGGDGEAQSKGARGVR
jgi:hypothetical protein